MGASKTHQYPVHTNYLARTGKAIGHSARVTILNHLSRNGAISHNEILRLTQLSNGTVCQH